jgi:hypothetical protein
MSTMSIITPNRPMTDTAFCTWVGQAAPGDTLEYHRGFLAFDLGIGVLAAPEQKTLRQLARRAACAFEAGLVHLVQRRKGLSEFSYLAIKRPRPRSARRAKAARTAAALEPELEDAA